MNFCFFQCDKLPIHGEKEDHYNLDLASFDFVLFPHEDLLSAWDNECATIYNEMSVMEIILKNNLINKAILPHFLNTFRITTLSYSQPNRLT